MLTLAPLLALALIAGPFAVVASAEPGCGGVGRPTCTILRPLPGPSREQTTVGWGQDCIVIVGGFGSPTDGSDAGFFSMALGDLAWSIDHRLIRFGVDQGDYETTGAISRSGAELRRVIRSISPDCDAIHLLAHSMGGVVVDRALAKTEPAALGVATYVAMASPHNGATLARVVTAVVEHEPLLGMGITALSSALDRPVASDAVRDLATTRAARRIPRLEHVRVRMKNDLFVHAADHRDRRVDVREFDPATWDEKEGHGDIVRNERVQTLVRQTVRTGRVPPERSATW